MLIKIGNFEFTEVWDGVLYKKLSSYPQVTDWERRTLVEFIEYENFHVRSCPVECEDERLLELINSKLRDGEKYKAVPRSGLLTECTACPYDKVRKSAEKLGLKTAYPAEPFRWSEDFGYYLQRTRGAFIGVGCGKDHAGLHTMEYEFEDGIIGSVIDLYKELV